MLKLRPKRPETIAGKVQITVPGMEKPETFTGIFTYRDRKEYLDFIKSVGKGKEIDAIMSVLSGWEDVEGDFTRENVELIINGYPCAYTEIISAYGKALFESRVKN